MFAVTWFVNIALVLQGCDGFRAVSTSKWSYSKLSLNSNNNQDHQPQSMRQREIGPLQRQWQSLPWLAAVVAGVTTFRPTVANAGILPIHYHISSNTTLCNDPPSMMVRHILIYNPLYLHTQLLSNQPFRQTRRSQCQTCCLRSTPYSLRSPWIYTLGQ